jgi:hypothetical protein
MRADYWESLCGAQGLHFFKGAPPQHLDVFGFVLGRDALSVYPIGAFERCGELAVYPPHTLNPTEEDAILGAAIGLTRAWDKTGVVTLSFVKQRDGIDFALLDVCEETGTEAKHLLSMRGLEETFMEGNPAELLELLSVGVSSDGELYIAGSLREALLLLPEAARVSLTGWYEKVLRYEG